jgi:hypothetical protein
LGNHLHIVSFDIPYPADYGGVIDVFHKVKSLAEKGTNIHLHCFEYGRKHAKELNRICQSVHYYKRNTSKRLLINKLPYIVVSRKSEELIKNLAKDEYPVLFEGLHTCYPLSDERLKNKTKAIRLHNIEHHYYAWLAKTEENNFKKKYFLSESKKLKTFEKNLKNAELLLAISPADYNYYTKLFKNVHYLPAFHPSDKVDIATGVGKYALYHGNLSVNENYKAALYLINNIFSKCKHKLIIAGKSPDNSLFDAAKKYNNIEIIHDVKEKQMAELIRSAHINILPTFQDTGIKLKLLNALFNGRFCIVNNLMIKKTGLENLCHICNTDAEFISSVNKLMKKKFSKSETDNRKKTVTELFSNSENAQKLINLIF